MDSTINVRKTTLAVARHASTEISGVTRLLIGSAEPERMSDKDVTSFLTIVRDCQERGSDKIPLTTQLEAMDRVSRNKLACSFLQAPGDCLKRRIQRIVTQTPNQTTEVTRALAREVRLVEQETQQILLANIQISIGLKMAVRSLALTDKEKATSNQVIRSLDASRNSAIEKINMSLVAANHILVNAGAPGSAAIAKALLGK